MKKTLSNSIALLAILLFTLFHSSDGLAQGKTLTYDWSTKQFAENKTLPFDEIFNIKISNLDPNIKSLKMIIKEWDDTKCKSRTDTVCFEELRTVSELIITPSKLQSTTTERLKPNKDYLIGFKVEDKLALSEQAKTELLNFLKTSGNLETQVNNLLSSLSFSKAKKPEITRILYKSIKAHNSAYELDTSAILKDKSYEMDREIDKAYGGLLGFGSKINDLAKNLKDLYHVRETTIKHLNSMIIPNVEDCCQLKEDFSKTSFLADLEKIKQEMINDKPKDSVKIKREIDFVSDGFIKEYNKRDKSIANWLKASLANVAVEKTYLVVTHGTTNIDPESTNTPLPYISQSFGYGFSPRTGTGLFYFTYSIFFRPMNLSVPFDYYKGSEWWATRFCANIGFSLEDVKTNKSGKISGLGSLFGSKAGIIGLGYRPLPFLKIDCNYMMYYMDDPNPLLNQKRFTGSVLFGVSVNLNIVKFFSGQPNSLSSLTRNNTNP